MENRSRDNRNILPVDAARVITETSFSDIAKDKLRVLYKLFDPKGIGDLVNFIDQKNSVPNYSGEFAERVGNEEALKSNTLLYLQNGTWIGRREIDTTIIKYLKKNNATPKQQQQFDDYRAVTILEIHDLLATVFGNVSGYDLAERTATLPDFVGYFADATLKEDASKIDPEKQRFNVESDIFASHPEKVKEHANNSASNMLYKAFNMTAIERDAEQNAPDLYKKAKPKSSKLFEALKAYQRDFVEKIFAEKHQDRDEQLALKAHGKWHKT